MKFPWRVSCMKVFFMVILLEERLIFPMQNSNMSNSPLWGVDVYPWILNSTLPKRGITDLEEYRCRLYSYSSNLSGWSRRSWRDGGGECFSSSSSSGGDGVAVLHSKIVSTLLHCIQFTSIDLFLCAFLLKLVDFLCHELGRMPVCLFWISVSLYMYLKKRTAGLFC